MKPVSDGWPSCALHAHVLALFECLCRVVRASCVRSCVIACNIMLVCERGV